MLNYLYIWGNKDGLHLSAFFVIRQIDNNQYLMNKSKLCKSALKVNQNSLEVAQNLSFIPLLGFRNGQIELVAEGLSVLEDQVGSKTYLLGYQASNSNFIFNLYRNNSVLNEPPTRSGVWISSYPRVDSVTGDQYLYLEIFGVNNDDKAKLHVICSLLCSSLIINLEETDSLSHLTAVQGRVVYSAAEKDQNKNRLSRKREIASLVLLQRSKGRGGVMKRDESQIYDVLSKSRIYDQSVDLYNGISLLQVTLEGTDVQQLDRFQQQIKDSVARTFTKFAQLTNGAILGFYLEQLVVSVNNVGMIDIDRCIKSIQVSPGYHAFQRAIEVYHGRLNRELKQQGIPNLKEELLNYRQEATDEFKKHSTDGVYLLRLGEYIDVKEQRLLQENDKSFELSNINYLKNESKVLLDRINREKVSEEEAKRLIDKFISDYRNSAQGENRFELLTNCLTILEPAVYKVIAERENTQIKKESQQVKRERNELENRVAELQDSLRREREKSSKCCEIM